MRALLNLPWADIGWICVITDLALVTVSPAAVLALGLLSGDKSPLGALFPFLVMLCGALGGWLARQAFDRLVPTQLLSMQVRWSLALGVGLTAGLIGFTLQAFFAALPSVLNFADVSAAIQVTNLLSGWFSLGAAACSPTSLVFPIGCVLGMFWNQRGGSGRRFA